MLEVLVAFVVAICSFFGLTFIGYFVASFWKHIPFVAQNRNTFLGIGLLSLGLSSTIALNLLLPENRWVLTAFGTAGLLLGLAAGLRHME